MSEVSKLTKELAKVWGQIETEQKKKPVNLEKLQKLENRYEEIKADLKKLRSEG